MQRWGKYLQRNFVFPIVLILPLSSCFLTPGCQMLTWVLQIAKPCPETPQMPRRMPNTEHRIPKKILPSTIWIGNKRTKAMVKFNRPKILDTVQTIAECRMYSSSNASQRRTRTRLLQQGEKRSRYWGEKPMTLFEENLLLIEKKKKEANLRVVEKWAF